MDCHLISFQGLRNGFGCRCANRSLISRKPSIPMNSTMDTTTKSIRNTPNGTGPNVQQDSPAPRMADRLQGIDSLPFRHLYSATVASRIDRTAIVFCIVMWIVIFSSS